MDLNNLKFEEFMDEQDTESTIASEQIEMQEDMDTREIKEKLENLEKELKEIKEQQRGMKNLLIHILEEVKTNKNAPGKLVAHKRLAVIPESPFTDLTSFTNFEKTIQESEEKYNDLVSQMQQNTDESVEKLIKNVWRKILTDAVAKDMCWKGTEKKVAVRALSVTQALKAACLQKFSNVADNFERVNIRFFQFAKVRKERKEMYQNKHN